MAMAELSANATTTLFLIDKRDLKETKKSCQEKKSQVFDFKFDLTNTKKIPELCSQIFKKIKTENVDSIDLINNAAETIPLKIVGNILNDELDYAVKTNISHYFLMTNEFIGKTKDLETTKRIINISSGAATNVIKGAAHYCAAKAAIDMFTKVVAKEQKNKERPVMICATTPGIIDTGMQVDLRTPPKEQFPSRNEFVVMKKLGLLQSPEKTAEKILRIFEWKKFPQGKILKYRKDL